MVLPKCYAQIILWRVVQTKLCASGLDIAIVTFRLRLVALLCGVCCLLVLVDMVVGSIPMLKCLSASFLFVV
jgi:hypothetical protein